MEEFIRKITDQMRCVRAREGVAKELADHIQDQAAAYEEAGTEHDEAVKLAVREMGDPVEIGVELDRIHRPQTDVRLVVMIFGFSLGGLFLQYIAGGLIWPSAVNGLSVFLSQLGRQCLMLLLSFGVMTGMYFLDYSFIGRYAVAIYGVLTVVFIIVFQMMPVINGRVPTMGMLVYLYIPVYAGVLYRMRGKGDRAVWLGAGMQFLTAALVYGFTDMVHTTCIVYLIQMVMMILAIHKNWFTGNKEAAIGIAAAVLVILPAACVTVPMLVHPASYSFRIHRIMAFLNPMGDPEGSGYVYLWIRKELSQARWIGASGSTSFVDGSMAVWPETWSDPFALLQVVCTSGILAGVLVMIAFVLLLVRAFHIVKRQKNQLGFMISAACFMVLLFNCVEGVLLNSGYYPVTSVQFPFLSTGGSVIITYAVFIGLMLSIYRNERIITDRVVTEHPAWRLSVKLEKK